MPTATPYNAANATIPSVPSDDPRGLGWNLVFIGVPAEPSHIRWLRSAYPDATWLQECKPTQIVDKFGRPPIAMQALSLIARPEVTSAARTSEGREEESVSTIMTVDGPKTSAEDVTRTVDRDGSRRRPTEASGGLPRSSPPASNAEEEESTSKSGYVASRPEGSGQSGSQQPRTSTTVTDMPSESPLPSPKPAASQPQSYASSSSPGSHHADPSSAIPPPHRTTTTSEIPIVITSGHVVVSHETLSINQTVTLGSGSTITKLALETNHAGDTVVVEGVVTSSKQPQSPQITESSYVGNSGAITSTQIVFDTSASDSPLPSSTATLVNAGFGIGEFRHGLVVVLAIVGATLLVARI